VLLFGSAMNVLPRRLAVKDTLAQEETWGAFHNRRRVFLFHLLST
jgi:hypothetical protein